MPQALTLSDRSSRRVNAAPVRPRPPKEPQPREEGMMARSMGTAAALRFGPKTQPRDPGEGRHDSYGPHPLHEGHYSSQRIDNGLLRSQPRDAGW